MLESWRSYDISNGMLHAQNLIQQDDRMQAFSLTDAMESQESCMTNTAYPQFIHMGLDSYYAEECAKMFCELAEVGSSGKHSTNRVGGDEKLQARTLLQNSQWIKDNLWK